MEVLLPWLQFAVCLAAIGLAGPMIVRSGEAIALHTGMSRSWIGLIMLATATSLPELFTGVSAVSVANAPDIAVGDALGSCLFNLVMLVLLDALCRDEPVWTRSDQGHILTAGFGVILIAFVGALILVARDELDFEIGHVSIYTPILVLLYLVAMRSAYFYERRSTSPNAGGGDPGDLPLSSALVRYAFAGGVIAVTGFWLPFVGLDLAAAMGWKTSFVGTLFVAAATSLPEFIVAVSALRMGSADMAIGNLLGSNLIAILVIAIDDIAYRQGSLLADVSPAHAVTAFAGAMMAGICIVALLYRPGNRFFGVVGWVSLALLSVYLLSSYAVYLHGH
ncbi:MAG: sodium:calcium antiporter [Novosphingobium sp.]|nr:sodium:calcium antiporter [Novosphingobium sp.]